MLLLVLAILAIGVFLGYRAGLIKIALSLSITIVSVILVALLSPLVTALIINHTNADENITTQIFAIVEDTIGESLDGLIEESVEAAGVEEQIGILNELGSIENEYIPEFLTEAILESNTEEMYDKMGVNNIIEYLANFLARWILRIIVSIVMFILVFIALRIAAALLNVIAMLPLLKGSNKIIGGLIGFTFSLLIVWIMFTVVELLQVTQWGLETKNAIEQNPLLNTIYSSNVILKIMN